MTSSNDRNSNRRIGVFGGTFDPIHIGHLLIASELRYNLGLERVLFLPAGRPPHKTDRDISPDNDRLAMLEAAIKEHPEFEISYVDIERHGLSYTADSLAILQDAFPDAELYFLMGQDSLRDFPNWQLPGEIARRAWLGVALRPYVRLDTRKIEAAVPETEGRICLVRVPLIQIASSDIRERVRDGRPIDFHVPDKIQEYIERAGLYR